MSLFLRPNTPAEKAGRKIALWVIATAICVGFWAQSVWAFWFVHCLVGTVAEVYQIHLDIQLQVARREHESEDV